MEWLYILVGGALVLMGVIVGSSIAEYRKSTENKEQ